MKMKKLSKTKVNQARALLKTLRKAEKVISLGEWDNAPTEQRQKWIEAGYSMSLLDALELNKREMLLNKREQLIEERLLPKEDIE